MADMDTTVRAGFHRGPLRQPRPLWVGGVIAIVLAGPLVAGEPVATRPSQPRPSQPRPEQARSAAARSSAGRHVTSRTDARPAARSPKIDHAVMPAGGDAPAQDTCNQCRRAACPQCRLATGHHQEHAQCQHGLCPAHCPVRPDVFGFYGTRWRRWPGSGVVQASNDEAATPVRPPRAEVPEVEEESLEPDAAAEDLPAPEEQAPGDAPDGDPAAATQPAAEAAAEEIAAHQQEAGDEAVGRTAWRTFTATPPRIAAQR